MNTRTGSRVEEAYRSDGGRMQRALFLFTQDREMAKDAVAEAFAQALGRGEAVRDVRRWVWRAAFRIASGEMKKIRRTSHALPERTYETPEPLLDLTRALARLSPKQRASVILHHYAGYPAREVARIIGSTPVAVAVHLSQGRRRLRGLLEDTDA